MSERAKMIAGIVPLSADLAQYISSIDEIVEDARNGRMFILVDAEDRENEGDLVIPAQMATPDAINFMAKNGRGLICLALTKERAAQLDLTPMARRNQMRNQTAFTVSIEARDGISTGISAHDRARTVSIAIDQSKGAADIVSPGHVFPLIGRDGGVLVRAGHTEAAIDLARLSGLNPSGVICEIMSDDGTMARLPELIAFAQRHNIKIGTIADLIAYRRKHDHFIRCSMQRDIETAHGVFKLCVYVNDLEYAEHIALVYGDVTTPEPVLVRVHAVNVVDDLIGANAGADSTIQRAMAMIAQEGRGVIVLIRDTRPTVVSERMAGKPKDTAEQPPVEGASERLVEYGVGAQMLLDLGVRDMIILSNRPDKKVVGLDGYGLHIVGHRPL